MSRGDEKTPQGKITGYHIPPFPGNPDHRRLGLPAGIHNTNTGKTVNREDDMDHDGPFPGDAEERLQYPIYTGLLNYFPNACAAVAHHSHVSNEQHNPGEPVHWDRSKSVGDGNQIVRHLMEGDLEACAWRALELLERELTSNVERDRNVECHN